MERVVGVVGVELCQQDRVGFKGRFCSLGGHERLHRRQQVDLLDHGVDHHVLAFWAEQNHVGLVLTVHTSWKQGVLLAEGVRYNDFELCTAVRSH